MISDVLCDAIDQIREYQRKFGRRKEVENIVAVMDAFVLLSACPAGYDDEHQVLLDDLRAGLKDLKNSSVIAARKRLLDWVKRERRKNRKRLR